MNLYKVGYVVVSALFKGLFKIKVIGKEKFPKDEGVLLCSNHISNFDPPLVGISCPREIHFMAKAELFKVPVLKGLLPKINAFPVRRGMSDKQALRTGMQLLNDKKVLGLFPEGTRNKTGEIGKGFAGAGFFALRTNAKIVPCAIIGPIKLFHSIKVVFGDPIDFEQYRNEKISAQEATDVIMEKIQQLYEEYKD